MADQFLGEIRIVAFNFAPRGWAACNGQTMPISQNTALFALFGTFYGGDGRSTFGLPNFQGCAPMCMGQGSGLSNYGIGQAGGTTAETLNISTMAAHMHTLQARPVPANTGSPANASLAQPPTTSRIYKQSSGATTGQMAPQSITFAGGNSPHNNMQPYLCMYFIVALQGDFPPRQ